MTVILHTKPDKEKAIKIIELLIAHFMYHGLRKADTDAVSAHLDWMERQTDDLRVNAKIETQPETQTTKITLELSFAPEIKPFEKN